MSAVIGQDWRPKTLRELCIQWQAFQLDRWHHTAHIKGSLASKAVPYEKLHPYFKKMKSAGIPVRSTGIFRNTIERIQREREG